MILIKKVNVYVCIFIAFALLPHVFSFPDTHINSTIIDSTITSSDIINSYIDPSIVLNSTVLDSAVINSTKVRVFMNNSFNLGSYVVDSTEINASLSYVGATGSSFIDSVLIGLDTQSSVIFNFESGMDWAYVPSIDKCGLGGDVGGRMVAGYHGILCSFSGDEQPHSQNCTLKLGMNGSFADHAEPSSGELRSPPFTVQQGTMLSLWRNYYAYLAESCSDEDTYQDGYYLELRNTTTDEVLLVIEDGIGGGTFSRVGTINVSLSSLAGQQVYLAVGIYSNDGDDAQFIQLDDVSILPDITVHNSSIYKSTLNNTIVIVSDINTCSLLNSTLNTSHSTNSYLRSSSMTYSSAIYSTVEYSSIYNSSINAAIHSDSTSIGSQVKNSSIFSTMISDSYLTDSNIYFSYVNSSTILQSVLDSVNATDAEIRSSTLCPMRLEPGTLISDNLLIAGRIMRNNRYYYPPYNITLACHNMTPYFTGTLSVAPSVVQPDSLVTLTYASATLLSSLTASGLAINGTVSLLDDGVYPDVTAGDGIYTSSALSTQAYGSSVISTNIYTALGDMFNVNTTIVIDSIPPTCQLNITSPITRDGIIQLGFTATDDLGLSDCTIDDPYVQHFLCSSNYIYVHLPDREGNITIAVMVEDKARNNGTCSIDIIHDTVPPLIDVITNISGQILNGTFRIDFNITDLHPYEFGQYISVDGLPQIPVNNSGSYLLETTDYPDGAHLLIISATDAAQNTATREILFYIDNLHDPVQILYPLASNIVQGDTPISVISPTNTKHMKIKVINASGVAFMPNGSIGLYDDAMYADGWSSSWKTTLFPDGNYTLQAEAYGTRIFFFDYLIGTDLEWPIIIDNTFPDPPDIISVMYVNNDTINITWSSIVDAHYYIINITDKYYSTTLSYPTQVPWFYKTLPDGRHQLRVASVDVAGHVSWSSPYISIIDAHSPRGHIRVEPSVAKWGTNITVWYYADTTGYNVSLNTTLSEATPVIMSDKQNNGVYSALFTVDNMTAPDDSYPIFVHVIDLSGMKTYNTTINLDNTPPDASMQIIPHLPAGFTETAPGVTADSVVTIALNLTSDAVRCRYRESSWSPWEYCISLRPFSLSNYDGQKTIWAEVKDMAGNSVLLNATIYLNHTGAGLDTTPPSAPEIYDNGPWANTHFFTAYWSPAYDRESDLLRIPLRYEVRLSDMNNTILSPWHNVSSMSLIWQNMSFEEGHTYLTCIRAYNSVDMFSAACSDGVTFDYTGPQLNITNASIRFNLTSEGYRTATSTTDNIITITIDLNDTISGVAGLSYLVSKEPRMPAHFPRLFGAHHNLTLNLSDGIWYLSMLPVDNAGNWANLTLVTISVDTAAGPPSILNITPTGITATEQFILIAQTDEYAGCIYNLTNPSPNCLIPSQSQLITDDGLYHQAILDICNGLYNITITCTDIVGLTNTTTFSLLINTSAIPDSISIIGLPNLTATGSTLRFWAEIMQDNQTVYGLQDELLVLINGSRVDYEFIGYNSEAYMLQVPAPIYPGTYQIELRVRLISAFGSFATDVFSLTVNYVSPKNITVVPAAGGLVSKDMGNIVGLAGTNVTMQSTDREITLSTKGGESYIIFTSSNQLRNVQDMFEDVPLPRFGLPTDSDTYTVGTKLLYNNIHLPSMQLPEGSYNLIITNVGITNDGKVNITVVRS